MNAPTPDAEKLADAMTRARAAYDALSPMDKALADADQKRSFIRGQGGRDPGPDVLAEEVRRLRVELAARPSPPVTDGRLRELDKALAVIEEDGFGSTRRAFANFSIKDIREFRQALSLTAPGAENDAYKAMRWVYEHGLDNRPEWVTAAFSKAYDGHRSGEAPAQPVEAGWRAISEAPMDGTVIHVWAPGFEWPEAVRWQVYDPDAAEEIGADGYWTYAEELLADATDDCAPEAWTHFMPLPSPPVQP